MTEDRSGEARLRARWHDGLVGAVLVLGAWFIAPGRIQPDTKLDLVLDPWTYLGRALSAWNAHTGVGELQNQAYGYLFPMGPVFGIAHTLGLSGWVAQRIWWSLVVGCAFTGMLTLLRRLRWGAPPAGGDGWAWATLAAAAAYALAPRVLTVLAEISVEVWPAAVAPWLVVAVLPMVAPGATGSARRAAALRSGVLATALGGVNATASLVAFVPALVFLLSAPAGRRRGRALCWWLAGIGLGAAWWLAPLGILGRYAYPFLDYIETASVTTAVASLPNVLRGAAHWIAYILTSDDHPTWQSGWVLAQSVTAIIATSVLAGAALAGLVARWPAPPGEQPSTDDDTVTNATATNATATATATNATAEEVMTTGVLSEGDAPEGVRSAGAAEVWAAGGDPQGRHVRRFALVSVLLGVVSMGIGYSGRAGSPFAGQVQQLLDGPLSPLRNIHKADLLLRLPMSIGLAALVVGLATASRRLWLARVALGLVVLAALGSLAPVWQGRVGDAWSYAAVPDDWRRLAADVDGDAVRRGGTTLLLPGARFAEFAWGRTNDEPLPTLAASPVLVRAAAPLGHPGVTRLLDRIDELAASGLGSAELTHALERLDITRVVVRTDLVAATGAESAALVGASLRQTPDTERVKDYGPLSLWRVGAAVGRRASIAAATDVVAVQGGAEAIPEATAAGVLPAGVLTSSTGAEPETAEGAPTIRTDGLRWRVRNSGLPPADGYSDTLTGDDLRPSTVGSRELPPGEVLGRSVTRRWGAVRVTATSSADDPFGVTPRGPGTGPAAAVDGDPSTAWLTGDGTGSGTLTLTFADGVRPPLLRVQVASGPDVSAPRSVTAHVGERRVSARVIDGVAGVDLSALGGPSWDGVVDLSIVGSANADPSTGASSGDSGSATTSGSPPEVVGITEITAPGQDLAAALELPDGPGDTRAIVLSAGSRARPAPLRRNEDPATLHRLLPQLPEATWRLTVTLAAQERAFAAAHPSSASLDSENALERALDGATVTASSRASGALAERPGAAFDGDPSTRWRPLATDLEPTLTVTFPQAVEVHELRILDAARATSSMSVEIDGRRWVLGASGGQVPTQTTRTLTVRFSRTDLTAEWVAPELDVSGWVAPMRLELDCGSAAIVTVGEARASFALSADTSALVHGAPVLAKACGGDLTTAQSGPVLVRAEAGPGLAVRALVLARPLEVRAALEVPVRATGDTMTLTVPAGPARVVALDVGANDGWRAVSASGEQLAARTFDGWRQGFAVPAGTAATEVTVTFAPNRWHRLGLGAGLVASLLLALGAALTATPGRVSATRGQIAGPHAYLGADEIRSPLLPKRSDGPPDVDGPVAHARAMARGRGSAGAARAGALVAATVTGALLGGLGGAFAAGLAALTPTRWRSHAVAATLTGAGLVLATLGVVDHASLGALLGQLLGLATVGILVAAVVNPGARGG